MPVIETQQGACQQCGHSMTLVVYWPHVVMLRKLLQEAGNLVGLADDDLEVLFADAAALDEYDQGVDGELDATVGFVRNLLTDAVVIDGGKEQAVTCPKCGALVGLVARERVG